MISPLQFWLSKRWAECLSETQGISISSADSSADIKIRVKRDDLPFALPAIMGYSRVVYGGLERYPPVQHPFVKNLYASSVDIYPEGLASYVPGVPKPVKTSGGLRIPAIWYSQNSDNFIPLFTAFEEFVLSIRFQAYTNVNFLPNSAMAGQPEYVRFTDIRVEPQLETLQADNMAFLVFVEGPPINEEFPVPIGMFLPKKKITLRWMWVPNDYVSTNRLYFNNPNIEECLGAVNNEPFLGFDTYTLLFTGYTTEPTMMPVYPPIGAPISLQKCWDITFEFLYSNPPPGVSNPIRKGHFLFPWREDGKFYTALVGESYRDYLPTKNFEIMFESVM